MKRHLAQLRKYTPRYLFSALFLKRTDGIYYLIFLFLSGLWYVVYSHHLMFYALSVEAFEINQTFSSSPTINLTRAGNTYLPLFILLVCVSETFIIIKILKLRKKLRKVYLLTYTIAMQVFPLLALFLFFFAAQRTVGKLTAQANQEITHSIRLLNNTHELQLHGIAYSPEAIAEKLQTAPLENFSIKELRPKAWAILQLLNIPTQGKTTLYNALILPRQLAHSQADARITFGLLLFPNLTLVIDRVTKSDVETLAGLLAERMIKTYYQKYVQVDSPPATHFLDEYDYVIHQTQKEEETKQLFEKYMSDLTAYIAEVERLIAANQKIIDAYEADRVFLDENKTKAQQHIREQLADKTARIAELESAKEVYKDIVTNPITADFQDGVFTPPQDIYIRFYDQDHKSFTFYLLTLIHEYFHYYSFVPTATLPTFLNEGITDYLKNTVATKHLEVEQLFINYPDEVGTVELLFQNLSSEELIELYFDQDRNRFQKLFVNAYSQAEYENFLRLGENIFFTALEEGKTKNKYSQEIQTMLLKQ